MTRLSAKSEERDALDVLKAGQRELEVSVRLDRLLRAGGGKSMEVVRASGREQIVARLEELRRSRFRGRISLIIDLEFPPAPNQPALTRAVKGYIDLLDLHGDVVADDDAVDHLIVLARDGADPEPTVTMLCTPVTVFTSDFDRALRIADEVTSEPEDDPARYVDGEEMPQDPESWGRHHFGETARELLQFDEGMLATIEDLDAQMLEQLAEDPGDIVDYDVMPSDGELTDPDVREAVRTALEPRVAEARGHWLADQSIDARDRPGDPPPWIEEVRDLDLADIRTADDTTPGCFILPPPLDKPGTSAAWLADVRRAFEHRVREPQWRRARFPGPIALDIALRGSAASFKDIDNRARDIITVFNEAFAPIEPVLGGYRVYRLPGWPSDDIRVRLLPESRLRQLALALGDARAFVAANRRERTRHLDPPGVGRRAYGR